MSTEAQKKASRKYYLKHKEYYSKKSSEDVKKARYERKKYKSIVEKAINCINYYAIEDDDYSKIYNEEEKELLNILQGGVQKKKIL